MRVLLVEPEYYTQYPPLGLLKLSTFHKRRGDQVKFVRGRRLFGGFIPDEVCITSLFTWAWGSVWESVHFYKTLFPSAKVRLGGIYASLMPTHAKQSGADEVFTGTSPILDGLVPDYDLVPKCNANIISSTRGCLRKCQFCAVPAIEPKRASRTTVRELLDPRFRKLVLWDNNFFGAPHWREILEEIQSLQLAVDFNQGIDARLVTDEVVNRLSGVKVSPIRLAYDAYKSGLQLAIERAIGQLARVGFRKKGMVVYVLYNFKDSPDDLFFRVRDLLRWGVTAYPMRYEPLDSVTKNTYVAADYGWTTEALEMVADARRVIGFGGAFPPYKGLVDKFNKARDWHQAMQLRPYRGRPLVEFGQDLGEMGSDHGFPMGSLALPASAYGD